MGSIAEVPALSLDSSVYRLFEDIENSFKDTGLGTEMVYHGDICSRGRNGA